MRLEELGAASNCRTSGAHSLSAVPESLAAVAGGGMLVISQARADTHIDEKFSPYFLLKQLVEKCVILEIDVPSWHTDLLKHSASRGKERDMI